MFREEPRFACALEALERRDFAEAERELTALLDGDALAASGRAFLLNKRGVARVGAGLRDAARADFDSALAASARYAPALTNLGNMLLEEGDVDAAIARYEEAIASDGEYATAHFNLGVAYKRAGRLAEGVKALRRAQRLEGRASAVRSWPSARRR
ncbi:MAG TPA: tetratricopeptide repeat protein [Candidatus Binatia bacterium]|nr:tetratricopeptide repeat protein [Candidatus Binatia bacterium]